MHIRQALKEQYHAGLAMLADCIRKCPDDLWTTPNPAIDDDDRIIYRAFWRIAFHAVFFTHLYLGQTLADFKPWPGRKPGYFDDMWSPPWSTEPYEFPEDAEPMAKQEMLDYLGYLDSILDPTIDALDLDTDDCGIDWYRKRGISKMSHELLNLRHLQGHVGQLSELLLARGLDPDWVTLAK
ncbi:MAG: hypothetical protein KF784_06080 [Fimbriimonadaceae bacterium]|nr:hypothetical protein [Fimbriimonadaceae bacterium]